MNADQSLQWHHDERHGVSNHRRLDSLLQTFVQVQIKDNIQRFDSIVCAIAKYAKRVLVFSSSVLK